MKRTESTTVLLILTLILIGCGKGESPGPSGESAKPVMQKEEGKAAEIAVVNGVPINRRELEKRVNRIVDFYRDRGADNTVPPEMIEDIRQTAFDNMLNIELLYQEAGKTGIEVSGEEVEKEFNAMIGEFPDRETFMESMRMQGRDIQELREETRRRLTVEKFTEEVIRPDADVDEAKAREYYNNHPEEFTLNRSGEFGEKGDVIPFDKYADRIIAEMEHRERQRDIGAYLDKLYEKADIVIKDSALARKYESIPD